MGLSNIFSLLTLFLLGPLDAFVLVLVRTTLGSVFTGNMSTLMYSLSAGVVSVAVSSVLVEFAYPKVSIVAVSVVSAIMHNVAQNVVFCLVSNTPEMFSYLPWLALLGILAGLIVGFAVWFILRAVPVKTFAAILDGFSADENVNAAETESGTEQTDETCDTPDESGNVLCADLSETEQPSAQTCAEVADNSGAERENSSDVPTEK